MPQTSLALLATGLLSGLILSWPTHLSAPPAHRLLGAPGVGRAAGCDPRGQTGERRCRVVTPAPDDSADEGVADTDVLDDLRGCTPFLAIDGDRELDFDTAHGEVIETVISAAPQRSGGNAPSRTRIGTFSTAERTGQVITVLAGVRRKYTLIIPADGTQCILALGAAPAANLEQSWFGPVSDGANIDPPPYQHAAAPRFHGERAARPARLERLVRFSAM